MLVWKGSDGELHAEEFEYDGYDKRHDYVVIEDVRMEEDKVTIEARAF